MGKPENHDESETVSQVDSDEQHEKAAEQADSKEQKEFFEQQAGEEDLSQGYGH